MNSVPSAAGCVYPVQVPMDVKNKNIDRAPTANQPKTIHSTDAEAFLPADLEVREVLTNGGFSLVKKQPDGSEVFEYERVGRNGLPLIGKEAGCPPRYDIIRWGCMIIRCSCRAARGTSDACKHQKALAWWLDLPMTREQKAEAAHE